jgi:hypothetical protein
MFALWQGFSFASSSEFNVRHFGAVDDGIRLDNDAVAATFAACKSNGGGTVLFPGPGTYLLGPWEIACNNSVISIEPSATILSKSINTTHNWQLGPDCPEPSQGKTSQQVPSTSPNTRLNDLITP